MDGADKFCSKRILETRRASAQIKLIHGKMLYD
jgi:hypothetical protein